MSQAGLPNEAPSYDLELLRSFVNTVDPDTHIDELDSPQLLADWLAERSLVDRGTAIDPSEHSNALEFREAIRAVAVANCAGDLKPGAVATLNRIGERAALSFALGSDGNATLRPRGRGIDEAFGHLLAIMYETAVDGSFLRLKGCANVECQWLYIDQSKNRSRKWCEMESCGNAINARAYRHRRRLAPADGDPS